MYNLESVLKALEESSLSEALTRLELFAKSQNLDVLAEWAEYELAGYPEGIEIPSYRLVPVQWKDVYGRELVFPDSGDDSANVMLRTLPYRGGINSLEGEDKDFFVEDSRVQHKIAQIATRLSGTTVSVRGALITWNTIERLLKDITGRFRRKLSESLPDLKVYKATFDEPAYFLLVENLNLREILKSRWAEANLVFQSSAFLSTIILLGSILEGSLLAKIENNMSLTNRATLAPQERDDTGKLKVKKFKDWTLQDMIVVGHELGWLGREVADFSQALRKYRNLVHPKEQVNQGFNPTESTCKVAWEVVSSALLSLSQLD